MQNQEQPSHTNRLINSTSPYLLQHAHNPVDWYEWGEAALAKAKKEDKPILVSIGYSSCHWCHVMERESFEHEDVAKVMNENFICIKVDREERPDIDQIYMEAVQAMGINGGWPLNVFLTPEQKPFYGGTYYPAQNWVQLLQSIAQAFKEKRTEINTSADELTETLSRSDLQRFKQSATDAALQDDLKSIYTKLQSRFDTKWGGMDKSPKFVMPSTWLLLLRYYQVTKDEDALRHVERTLKQIAMGGIADQLGGGFARYSVDERWFAPHFEKMLYDNAQLMSLYAEAYAVTHDPEYRHVVETTFEWLERDMLNAEGGFYSALDADSEGVEGKYYIWTAAELQKALGDDATPFNDYYSVTTKGNWEHGANILHRSEPDETFLKRHQLTQAVWNKKLEAMKQTLMAIRKERIAPGLDDKVVTAWNGLMIVGLTDAYRYLGDDKYLKAAERNILFIENNLMEGNVLYRSYKDKRSTTVGFLDDYAFVIQAYTSLYQTTFNERYLKKAETLMTYAHEQFYDADENFFYYTSTNSHELITRKKEVFDNVIPASNSVMARNMLHLGILLDHEQWKKQASDMTGSLTATITSEPNYTSNWAMALMETKMEMAEVVITGPEVLTFKKEFEAAYQPFALLMGTRVTSDLPLFEGKVPAEDETTVFVCFNKACKRPVNSIHLALEQIKDANQFNTK